MAFNPFVSGMGIGTVGLGDPNTIIKRKFRWTMEVESNNPQCYFYVPPYFCRVSARPNLSFEETEINFLNDKMWIPGKATWESITVTYMDVAGTLAGDAAQSTVSLYQWLLNVFDFTAPNRKFMSSRRNAYTAKINLTVYDGCGKPVEQWILADAWPQSINFGDLAYDSSDPIDIELTLRYSQVQYIPLCPAHTFKLCCGGCQ